MNENCKKETILVIMWRYFKSKCFDPFNGIEDKYGWYRTDLGSEDKYFT